MHAAIAVTGRPRLEVEVKLCPTTFGFFPQSDCRLLPIANTTAEMLAEFIGHRLRGRHRVANRPAPGPSANRICRNRPVTRRSAKSDRRLTIIAPIGRRAHLISPGQLGANFAGHIDSGQGLGVWLIFRPKRSDVLGKTLPENMCLTPLRNVAVLPRSSQGLLTVGALCRYIGEIPIGVFSSPRSNSSVR